MRRHERSLNVTLADFGEIEREAARLDLSLSKLLQWAWKIARRRIQALPRPETQFTSDPEAKS